MVALCERLTRETGRARAVPLRENLAAIRHRCASLPVVDDRPAGEILGYDDHGHERRLLLQRSGEDQRPTSPIQGRRLQRLSGTSRHARHRHRQAGSASRVGHALVIGDQGDQLRTE